MEHFGCLPLTSCGISTLGEKLTLPIEEIIFHFGLDVNLQSFTGGKQIGNRDSNDIYPTVFFSVQY